MAAQTEYTVIKVCRSDGCDTGPGYWPAETPKPAKKTTKDVSEKVTRAKPQMVRLAEDDVRFIEWRVKLGILLKQEIAPLPNEGLPWYVDFPRNYWLYEKSKHLWVSGYPVKGKLFKSPQEFGVHLLWLLSSSGDRRDCCCVHCNVPSAADRPTLAGEDESLVRPKTSEEPRPEPQQTPYAKAIASLTAQGVQISQLDPQIKMKLLSLQGAPLVSTQSPTPFTPTASQPRTVAAAPPLPPQTQDHVQSQAQNQAQNLAQNQVQNQPANPQQRAQAASSLLYRSGELVWYTNGPSWRLGLIAQSANGTHQVLPIGHNRAPQPAVPKQDTDLRPFQAFTVPPVTSNDLKDRTYDEVPWETMLGNLSAEEAKKELGVILLDASKLAALKIDQSYSLFTKLAQKENMASYRGVFLGAERIEVGDTLRVVLPPAYHTARITYFGLKTIIAQEQPTGRVVLFRGTLYQLREWYEAQPGGIPDDALPRALREESIWRKSVAPDKPLSWNVLNPDMVFKEADIRGRFYPTHLLAPILTPADFASSVARGDRTAVVPALNGRLDSAAGATKNIGCRLNRVVTAGDSIPHDTVFGFEPQVREEVEGL